MQGQGRIVCFGEILVRLSAPDGEFLLQSPGLKACFGGAEANVAVSLARFGHDAAMLSVAPDNALGRAGVDELRRYGVDTSKIRIVPGRQGLYFLTPGAAQRPSQVLYDRAGSAFALNAGGLDWSAALAGAEWLHVSGVTAAIGPQTAAAALGAVRAGRELGLTISFDCNYRASLWQAWEGDAPAILGELLAHADLVFGDHRDIALVLGARFEGDRAREQAVRAAFEAYPRLKLMACTGRTQHTVNHHDLCGYLFARDFAWSTGSRPLNPIIDRIGGGDAFAAGLIHGLRRGMDEQAALEFAVAAGALKHALAGDFHLSTVAEVEALLGEGGLDVRR